MIRAGSSTE